MPVIIRELDKMLKKNEYKELEKKIGYRFRDRNLLEMALVHRSHRFENDNVYVDNQRLEFLGDAILGFLTASHLYDRYPDDDEGVLTSLRSQLTSGKALAELSAEVDVGSYLKIGKGEEGSGGRSRASNLADAFESIIGAAYLDGGMKAAEKIFKRLFLHCIDDLNGDVWADNPKGKLQDYAQRTIKSGPKYRIVNREGPAHATVFTVEVSLADGRSAAGVGNNKQEAETEAARKLLENISDDI